MRALTAGMVVLVAMALGGQAWGDLDNTNQVPQKLHLELDLVDGSRVIGVPSIDSLPVRTPYAKMNIHLKQILTVKIEEDHETASLELRNGDKLKVVITLEPILLETIFGKVSVGIEHIRELRTVLAGGSLPDPLRRGLVLYYSFDRNEGGTVTDQSGKRNNGEVKGAKWISNGKTRGAYAFNGRDARISIDNNDSLDFGLGPRTIAAWIKSSGASRDYQVIFDKGTNPGYAFRLRPSNRAIEYFKSEGNSYSFFTSSRAITDNAWHNLVVVDHGNGTVTFYKDGAFLEAVTKTNYNSDSNSKAAIGALPLPSMSQLFSGTIDEVMILNRALSKEEVKRIYNAQNGQKR